ncbi:protein YfhM [Enterobacter cloacae]|uniref:Protein YfhM n=1 Tax=Enterobacter cloacae TaxID=550 RepID=A0A377LVF0_ENTCL|nr:protein YfhM [Enterobacter cloacae]
MITAPIPPLTSLSSMKTATPVFDIVYADASGAKKAVSGYRVRLIRERRDYYGTGQKAMAGSPSLIKKISLKASRS